MTDQLGKKTLQWIPSQSYPDETNNIKHRFSKTTQYLDSECQYFFNNEFRRKTTDLCLGERSIRLGIVINC